jgi:hypothetical protein
LKRIVNVGGDRIRKQLRNADFDALMETARTPGSEATGKALLGEQAGGQFAPGKGTVDAKKLLAGLEDRQKKGTLATLYGRDGNDILAAAKRLAAKNGEIDARLLKPGNFRKMVEEANALADRLKDYKEVPGAQTAGQKLAAARADSHPTATVESSRVIGKDGEPVKPDTGAPKYTKAEKARAAADVFKQFGEKLADKTTLPTEEVPKAALDFAEELRKENLISPEKYQAYRRRVNEIADDYAKAKNSAKTRRWILHATEALALVAGVRYGWYRFGSALTGR